MSFVKIKSWLASLCVLALVACGGGGSGGDPILGSGSGTPILGSGTSVGGPTLTVGLSSTNITAQSPATITATVRNAAGAPISGVVVSFTSARTDLLRLTADSSLTNAQGMATVGMSAAASGLTGADTVTVIANLGTTSLTGKVGVGITGAAATLQAAIDNTTLRVSAGPVRFTATVRDATGSPMQGQLVKFASASGVVAVANASALTDGNGMASTTVTPADGSVGVADTLVASTAVNGNSIQSSINVQVISETPSIAIALSSTTIGPTAPATVQVTVRDANNMPVEGAIVSFSTQFGLGLFSATTATTAKFSGVATVALSPKTATSTGADVVVASVTINGATKVSQRIVDFVGAMPTLPPQLSVSLSSPTITPQNSGKLAIVLTDGGKPVVGAVISVATERGNLGVLSAATLLTDAQGRASADLATPAIVVVGADQVIVSAKVQGYSLQSAVGFSVDNAAPTFRFKDFGLNVVLPLRHSAGAAQLNFLFLNSTGQPEANRIVSFSAANKLIDLSAASAVTNSAGVASVSARAIGASVTGVDIVTATTVVSGKALQSDVNLPLLAEAPSVQLEILPATGVSTISSTLPATVRATVRNSSGALIDSALVTFSSQSKLGVFDANSAATVNGLASVKLSPLTTSTAGADVITVAVTVAGVTVTDQKVVQYTAASSSVRSPVLTLDISSASISSATPAIVTATLNDGSGQPVPSQVITFSVVRGLAKTNIGTALTNSSGVAVAVLSPTSSAIAGADEVIASASVAGVNLTALRGFQIQATDVSIVSFGPAINLSAYGQTSLTLTVAGASIGSPVNLQFTSDCASQGKATLSPTTALATSSTVTVQFRDNGCGAVQTSDQLQAVVVGTAVSKTVSIGLTRPDVSSIAFVQATPEAIFLKGSGFTETSVVRFEVRDGAGNPLPNQMVALELLTGAGGVTIQNNSGSSVGVGVEVSRPTDAQGRVEVRVNSGSQPTPVRIQASIVTGGSTIKTVSSNLSIGIGLPSQLNYSLSQEKKNIEGMNIDGTPNTYTVIASDRSGNPVPSGTSINFVTEGGQVESIKQTSLVSGIAKTTAAFVSANPRPEDGRVTVTSYALGEESFIDQNGNNQYDIGEPFQDLGNIFKDRHFNGLHEPNVDETVITNVQNSSACVAPSAATGATPYSNAILALDASIPSVPSTCDAVWSGAGKVYVRRAIETVLSTSAARPLWLSTAGLDSSCGSVTLQNGPSPLNVVTRVPVQQDTYYFGAGATSGTLSFVIADANAYNLGSPFAVGGAVGRLNPMAFDTKVVATTPTIGLKVVVAGGSPVANSSEATAAIVGVTFESVSKGLVFLTVTSPSGLASTFAINVDATQSRPSSCPR